MKKIVITIAAVNDYVAFATEPAKTTTVPAATAAATPAPAKEEV
jgi:hypothetical protein